MNKSRIARDFYRKVFADDIVNLSDADQRKDIVNQFFSDPINKKAGWHATKDRRFFRTAFQKVCAENNFNPLDVGVKPDPKRNKITKGTTKFNVKSEEKKIPKVQIPTTEDIKKPEQKAPLPNTEQINQQIPQAVYYSAQSVGAIFDTLFKIISARLPISPLTQNEIVALGEAWAPIFNQYFGQNSMWVMPVVITAPILLQRLAEVARVKKEKELKEKYGMNEPESEPEPNTEGENKWRRMGFGKEKTD